MPAPISTTASTAPEVPSVGGQFSIDGRRVPFEDGQTIIQAADAAGVYIPHLCHHRDFAPHGSCRVCTVKADGRYVPACTSAAQDGLAVENETEELRHNRREILQMLFVEGNHLCPGCEKSGDCQLQAVAYHCGMLAPELTHLYPDRRVDASHGEVTLDYNRCILCELCVRASREVDGKHVFSIGGRGIHAHLAVNSDSGRLADTALAATDRAVSVCPVGALMPREGSFMTPIGQRRYDSEPISIVDTRAGDRGEQP
jgi:[NiFe] hydrogenase diaphorase moiety small subunit